MSTHVLHLQPQTGAAAAVTREPLSDAVFEVSGRIAALNDEKRRHYSRLDELRSAEPSLRRLRPRALPVEPQRPLTIFSIEEATPEPSARQVRRA